MDKSKPQTPQKTSAPFATIFEKSQTGQRAYSLPRSAKAFEVFAPPHSSLRKTPLLLPEASELDLTRHFYGLARRNIGIDTNFIPLGSCTMKFNPRVNEKAAALKPFAQAHPLAPPTSIQGCFKVMQNLLQELRRITGMDGGTLAPSAGAQGEFTGVQMIAAYHAKRGDVERREMLIPNSAHGTNSATAAMAGFKVVSLPTAADGDISMPELKGMLSKRTAGLMLTNPNTLGLFSSKIQDIAALVHESGGLMYCDGANLNPLLEIARPADMGFDVMHVNLHKTFSTPHGGGGPGAGPVLCKRALEPFLPVPRLEGAEGNVEPLWHFPDSIGQIATFYGNFAIALRAYLYILLHGRYGLRQIAEGAILNANYLKKKLEPWLSIPYPQPCMHEFVAQATPLLKWGVKASDVAKRLLDYSIHAPTVYFPLIVKECLLIEPTEGESKNTLDHFIRCIASIYEESERDSAFVQSAPHSLSVRRLDEVRAARQPIYRHVVGKGGSS